MKKFIAGALTTIIITALTITALATTGAVSFNTINLAFNGEIISPAGEGFTLDNGQTVPASIVYTDELGGGTTYLPVRRVSELLGVNIAWNPEKGAVEVTGEGSAVGEVGVEPIVSEQPEPTMDSETAYQEFKAMWEINIVQEGIGEKKLNGTIDERAWILYHATYIGDLSLEECSLWYGMNTSEYSSFGTRMIKEVIPHGIDRATLQFMYNETKALGLSSYDSQYS